MVQDHGAATRTAALRRCVAGRSCLCPLQKAGGTRTAPLPDFFIGAHAEVEGLTLITRDAARFQTYFPNVKLIVPG